MNDPQISWYIVEADSSVVPRNEYYAGSCTPGETVEINIQVWNNRWGSDTVASAQGSKLAVYFDSIEDSYLLNLCQIKVDDEPYAFLRVEADKGYVDLPRELSGAANDGSMTNVDNYMNILFKFGPTDKGLRNSLKNLFLSLESDSQEL
jgi:hypothetical protein